jgi:hypothetical protein
MSKSIKDMIIKKARIFFPNKFMNFSADYLEKFCLMGAHLVRYLNGIYYDIGD